MTVLKVTSGSDVRLLLTMSSEGVPIDLTGRTVAVFGTAPQIADRATAFLNDAEAGVVEVRIDGTIPIPPGTYEFRVQISDMGASVGLPVFSLRVV